MEIPRIRILRHWRRRETSKCGMWLVLVEPRWPIFRFQQSEWWDDLRGFIPTKESDSLDIVLEYFDQTRTSGGCKRTIWALDLFDLMFWCKNGY